MQAFIIIFSSPMLNNNLFLFYHMLIWLHNANKNLKLKTDVITPSLPNFHSLLYLSKWKSNSKLLHTSCFMTWFLSNYVSLRNLLSYFLQMFLYSRTWFTFLLYHKLSHLPRMLFLHPSLQFITWLTHINS